MNSPTCSLAQRSSFVKVQLEGVSGQGVYGTLSFMSLRS